MSDTKKKQFIKYLLVTFSVAWVLQAIAIVMALNGQMGPYQVCLMVLMFAPMLGAFVAGGIKEQGWKPKLKGNLRFLFAAWLLPALLAIVGAVIYFIIVRSDLDLSGSYLALSVGEEGMAQLAAAGMTLPMYVMVSVISGITYAPWINMFLAVGEESGWRGYMYPYLKERFGVTKGRVIGGIIWGIWHWPIMFIGYEYGTGYWGYPILGPLMFCVFATSVGILLDALYDKTECIWIPALAHGAVNATSFLMGFMSPEAENHLLLGPLPIGLIGGSMFLLAAVIISVKAKKR